MKDILGGAVTAGPGFEAFLDPENYLRYGLVLVLATISGVILAYHPVQRGRPMSMEDIELRKTLIIYSAVGSLISIICMANPSMAFVIFGIGGLMRFRTDLATSKSTGHAIMGTIVGLCWGLGLQLVAMLATIYFWLLIYALEIRKVVELTVGGVKVSKMGPASEAYKHAIERAGGRLRSSTKNFKKEQMVFVFRLPRSVALDRVQAEAATIAEELRGTPDWPE